MRRRQPPKCCLRGTHARLWGYGAHRWQAVSLPEPQPTARRQTRSGCGAGVPGFRYQFLGTAGVHYRFLVSTSTPGETPNLTLTIEGGSGGWTASPPPPRPSPPPPRRSPPPPPVTPGSFEAPLVIQSLPFTSGQFNVSAGAGVCIAGSKAECLRHRSVLSAVLCDSRSAAATLRPLRLSRGMAFPHCMQEFFGNEVPPPSSGCSDYAHFENQDTFYAVSARVFRWAAAAGTHGACPPAAMHTMHAPCHGCATAGGLPAQRTWARR